MGFFGGLKMELSSIVDIFNSTRSEELSSTNENNSMTIKVDLNWTPAKSVYREKPVSPRVMLPQVQNSIEYFNKLSVDEKMNILDNIDQKLQDKLMVFMDYNTKFSDNIELTSSLLRDILECANKIAERNRYTEKELAVMLKEFQRFVAKVNIETDRMMNAFISYRDGFCEGVKISSDNKDEYAIGYGTAFKNKLKSYMDDINTNLRILIKEPIERKNTIMTAISKTLNDLQIELDDFQSVSLELLNGFIPEAVNEENKYYAKAKRYMEEGIPADLYLPNKAIENMLIDALLELVNATSVSAA